MLIQMEPGVRIQLFTFTRLIPEMALQFNFLVQKHFEGKSAQWLIVKFNANIKVDTFYLFRVGVQHKEIFAYTDRLAALVLTTLYCLFSGKTRTV